MREHQSQMCTTLMSKKWTHDTSNFQLLSWDILVWIKGGTRASIAPLISDRETVSWKPELDLGKSPPYLPALSGAGSRARQACRESPDGWEEYSFVGTLLSRLKINKGLDILVARIRCRLLGRWFNFTLDSNSKSEAVHYDWMSFWKIQALYIQLMGK